MTIGSLNSKAFFSLTKFQWMLKAQRARGCVVPLNIPKHVYYHCATHRNSASFTDLQAQLDWAVDSKIRQTLFALPWLLSKLI